MITQDNLVINIHNLSKTCKKTQVLKDINLTVPEHSIFGFLCPSLFCLVFIGATIWRFQHEEF